jgi:hypothetical protein
MLAGVRCFRIAYLGSRRALSRSQATPSHLANEGPGGIRGMSAEAFALHRFFARDSLVDISHTELY